MDVDEVEINARCGRKKKVTVPTAPKKSWLSRQGLLGLPGIKTNVSVPGWPLKVRELPTVLKDLNPVRELQYARMHACNPREGTNRVAPKPRASTLYGS
ncbi:hypothetical protein VTL71DRAFT_13025, partial [Oculimacula yallundae]